MNTTLDLRKHAAEYAERGYTVLRGFFTKDEAARMLSEIERCAELESSHAALNGNGIGFAGEIFVHSDFVRSLLCRQDVVDLIGSVAGGDLWISMDQAVTKHPGAGVFRWHQDNGYNRLKCEHFQLWVAVTETRLQNGALKLVPGSHKLGLLPHSFKGAGQMECDVEVGDHVTVDADAGDVILFSSLMLHCTGPNEADTKRVAYVAEYMRLRDYAPRALGPFFVAARDGRPCPHFTRRKPGALSLRNQLLYLGPRLAEAAKKPARLVRDALVRRA